jgi:hypothetical protein
MSDGALTGIAIAALVVFAAVLVAWFLAVRD